MDFGFEAEAAAAKRAAYAQQVAGLGSGANGAIIAEPELVVVLGRLNATREQIGAIESLVGGFVDRLNGGRPLQDDACGTVPMRSGLIGELHDRLDGIGMALDRIQKDAANLNRIA